MLLAVAVILPTVCLLWFLAQTVRTTQLAVRQELMAVYEDKLSTVSQEIQKDWLGEMKELDDLLDQNDLSDVLAALYDNEVHDVILYDKEGKRVYPLIYSDVSARINLSVEFNEAWELEFAGNDFAKAAKVYGDKARSDDIYLRFSALIGQSRCLRKLGEHSRAIESCKEVAFSEEAKTCDTPTLMLIADARLLLIEMLEAQSETNNASWNALKEETTKSLLDMIGNRNEAGAVIPWDRSRFISNRLCCLGIDVVNPESFLKQSFHNPFGEGPIRLKGSGIPLEFVERFSSSKMLDDWPEDRFRQWKSRRTESRPEVGDVDVIDHCYALRHKIGDRTAFVFQNASLNRWLSGRFEEVSPGRVACPVRDNLGWATLRPLLSENQGAPFMALPLGGYFEGWQVQLYFTVGNIFKSTVEKRIWRYVTVCAYVVIFGLAMAIGAGRAVGRQIKLNRLKNDFIATVSHELKTPLASMRVLADTLLEGNYTDQKQATEYLHLICKENKRLSGLIDNFLTFSRMERNKHTFEMVKTSPAAIANSAVEAVKTKFSEGQCEFEVKISNDLPDISADHDAIVTVLVNLLDNAYKYSHDDKHIDFRVYNEDGSVCFSVSDKGIGLSQRAIKKIFKRFYQVDSSLSRHAEGCGLGLSIAKFIVDAHKGSISVESIPGKGSTFTVKLPKSN